MLPFAGKAPTFGPPIRPALTEASRPAPLLADDFEFARIREEAGREGLMRDLAAFVLRLAEQELLEPVATRQMTGFRLLDVSRTVLRRVINCGLAYQLGGDARYARRAIADLQAAAEFTNWNPSHFLDVGEMCCAFALGLDWLREELMPAERLRLEEALIESGLKPGLADPDAVFITIANNWNAVCNGGLAMGALAVRHREPELADKLIRRCIEKLPLHGANYAPDGAFIEGPAYWSYGTMYHVFAIESLRRGTGSTHELDALPGFHESAVCMAHATGPSGEFYGYFDSRQTRVPLPAMLWFGRHYNDPFLTRVECDVIRRIIAGPVSSVLSLEGRCFALALIWLKPEHLRLSPRVPCAWSGGGANPLAFWRTGWTPDDIWLGAKGGRASLSHGHLDAGSFVFEAGGVRWAEDPGMEEYHRLESQGVDLWHKERWRLFRLGAEGHSIPRIDGARPDPDGACERVAWTERPHPSVTFDLTALYPGLVGKIHRTISSAEDGTTQWSDSVSGLAAGAVYRFTWVTLAGVRAEPGAVVLSKGGRYLRLAAVASAAVTVRVLDEAALLGPHDTPMPGIKRVEFAVTSGCGDIALEITASLVAGRGGLDNGDAVD